METTTRKLLVELQGALQRVEASEQPLRQFRTERLLRVNRDGYTLQMFKRDLAEFEASLRAHDDPRPNLYRLLDELCDAYLNCDAASRNELRTYVAQHPALGSHASSYARQLAAHIKTPTEIPLLRRALAAISMENCGSDYRDTLMALADVYVGAEQAGLDPRPHFDFVAAMSTDALTRGGLESMAQTMRTLQSYAVVRERRSAGGPYRPWA